MNDKLTERAGRVSPDGRAAAPRFRSVARKIRSVEIFAGAREVLIEHEGDEYRLRHTSKGKLILTK